MLTVTHNNKLISGETPDDLASQDVPKSLIGAAIKQSALKEIARFADQCRQRLSSASAGKLAEFRIKEAFAADPTNGHATALAKTAGLDGAEVAAKELALIEREATARGMDVETLTAAQAQRAIAYRQIALLIGALEAEAGAAVADIPDDASDIETQIRDALGQARIEADTAFANAIALINGEAQ